MRDTVKVLILLIAGSLFAGTTSIILTRLVLPERSETQQAQNYDEAEPTIVENSSKYLTEIKGKEPKKSGSNDMKEKKPAILPLLVIGALAAGCLFVGILERNIEIASKESGRLKQYEGRST